MAYLLGKPRCARILPQHHAADSGCLKREGTQQHCVDDTEDCAVCTDAQCERKHSNDRERGILRQHAQAVAQILRQIGKED